ncbi:MAG: response regulator, partial [Candidatus Omnitrophica bacterium]|nr:response regulator [Candidatus Omnitrophota bacterium]
MDERILVIEDDATFLETLLRLLKLKGYNVKGAKDGVEAVEMVRREPFDLIITDVRLPGGMDGIEAVSKIKENGNSKIKTMVITGCADRETPLRAIKMGVDDYIYKPFEIEEFLHSVERNIKNLRLEKERERYVNTVEMSNKELVLLYEI